MRPRLPLAGARPLLAFFQRAISITPAVSKAADHQYTSARFLYDLDSQSTPRSSGSTPKTTATAGNYYNGTQRQEQERQRQRQPGDPTAAAAAAPSSEPLQNLLYNNHRTRATKQRREERTRRDEQRRVSQEYLQQMPRMWRDGDVLAPHDLSGSEMRKWRKRAPRTADVIDLLGINPLDHYSNFNLISEFIHPDGRIKHSSFTGLRAKNQRKVAKMVRRAIGMGIHPSVHLHPEILQRTWPKN